MPHRTAALAAAGLLLVAGCSKKTDDAKPAAAAVSPSAPAAVAAPKPTLDGTVTDKGSAALPASGAFEVEVDDNYFNPTFISGKAGQQVTLTVKSEGKSPHTFTIDDAKVDAVLASGATANVSVTLPASGFVRFYCKFHHASGMQGALYVG